jgi:hypothetical protein
VYVPEPLKAESVIDQCEEVLAIVAHFVLRCAFCKIARYYKLGNASVIFKRTLDIAWLAKLGCFNFDYPPNHQFVNFKAPKPVAPT